MTKPTITETLTKFNNKLREGLEKKAADSARMMGQKQFVGTYHENGKEYNVYLVALPVESEDWTQ